MAGGGDAGLSMTFRVAGRVPVVLLFAAAISGCAREATSPPAPAKIGATYVGIDACATCHAAIAASFRVTGMGRALYPMSGPAAKQYARFDATLDLPGEDLKYAMYERDGKYFMKQYQLDARGAETNVDVREMVYVIGSGNHCRSFVAVDEGRLYQMPVCWYPEADRWDLCPGYELQNFHFRRGVDDTCLFCHNGQMRPDGRFANSFEEPFPHGIDCERCHGPGSEHVERWFGSGEAGQPAAGTDDDAWDATILNPRRLSPQMQLNVCMQCHMGDSGQTERVLLQRADLYDHRPDRPLHETLWAYAFRQKLPGHFGLTGQADRMMLSRCYTETGGRMVCTTCHDPHEEVYEVSERKPDHFNAACLSCHAVEACTRPQRTGAGDCVGCHMRRAEPHDQRYTTFLDHWIRIRPGEDLDLTRDDYAMETLLTPPDGAVEPAPAAFMLGRAQYSKKISSKDGAGMPWDLIFEPLMEAARRDPNHAGARFLLGKAEMSRGRAPAAEEHFSAALRLDPGDARAAEQVGSALLAQGRFDEAGAALEHALKLGPRGDDRAAVLNERARAAMGSGAFSEARGHLERALAIEPRGPEILANLGFLAAMEQDDAAAAGWFRRSLASNPAQTVVHRALASSLAKPGEQQDLPEAIHAARRAVRLAPAESDGYLALSDVCRAAGDFACAREAADAILAKRPRDPRALTAKGLAALETGRVEEALALIGDAVQAEPRAAASRTALGRVYRALGREDEARSHLSRAAALGDPEAAMLLEAPNPRP